MFTSQPFYAVSIFSAGLFFSAGCESPEIDIDHGQANSSSTENQTESVVQPSTKVGSSASGTSNDTADLSMVLDAWESGNKDVAIGKLLQIDWDNPAASGGIPVMGYTEKEFATLSREQQAMSMKLAGDSKAILRHAFSLAKQAEGKGDFAKARQYYDAVRQLGNALSGPERLIVLQMMGKALVQMADEKLATLK